MKVRITNEDGIRWYKTGEVYEVDDNSSLSNKYYEAVNTSGTILKNHCKIISEKYTYLDVNLPEWWDGRPIYGEAGDRENSINKKRYCIGVETREEEILRYRCMDNNRRIEWFKYFIPLPKQQTTAKVVITKDGKETEVFLTDEQIEKLGIKE